MRDRRQPTCAPVDRRAARRRARRFPTGSSRARRGSCRSSSPTRSSGRRERLVYLSRGGDLTAYEELRDGLHGGRLARAADTARAPPLAARDRDAPRRGRPRPRRPGPRRGRADPRADRRGAVPQRARVRRPRRLARLGRRAAGARRGRRGARGARERGRASRSRSRATRRSSSRSGRACCASSPRTSPRTRSATPGPGRRSRSPSSARATTVVLRGTDDGGRRPGGGAPAALRAVLPRRPGARVARHGARPCDREAHRHAGRRRRSRRAAGWAPGSRSAASFRVRTAPQTSGVLQFSPDVHHRGPEPRETRCASTGVGRTRHAMQQEDSPR